ncbi:hypothetical protein BDQ17DRAFT_1344654 [Cyathus striatus]|nr:hypothetical protein BDQ17DRAFT_1344654 [Cyathus striatus]
MLLLSTLRMHLNSCQVDSLSQQFTVVQPPEDQQSYTCLRLFYFCYTDNNVLLIPMKDSPVLQHVGITSRVDKKDAPMMNQWQKIWMCRNSKNSAQGSC